MAGDFKNVSFNPYDILMKVMNRNTMNKVALQEAAGGFPNLDSGPEELATPTPNSPNPIPNPTPNPGAKWSAEKFKKLQEELRRKQEAKKLAETPPVQMPPITR
jgi:hypothetical protein